MIFPAAQTDTAMPGKILINYRRDGASGFAGHSYNRLRVTIRSNQLSEHEEGQDANGGLNFIIKIG